jgi:hypothetical protein
VQGTSLRVEQSKTRTYEKATVQSFPALSFDGIMGCAAFGRVSTTVRIALYSTGRRKLSGEIVDGVHGCIVGGGGGVAVLVSDEE